MEDKDYISFVKNPKVQVLFGYMGEEIRTKQDKFKRIENPKQLFPNLEELDGDLYLKTFSTSRSFEENIKKLAEGVFAVEPIFKKPAELEVILSITMKGRRFKSVDVDNLAKSVLDCLKGIAFEDDSQITKLLVMKEIMPTDSIMIGITDISDRKNGIIGPLPLFKRGEKW